MATEPGWGQQGRGQRPARWGAWPRRQREVMETEPGWGQQRWGQGRDQGSDSRGGDRQARWGVWPGRWAGRPALIKSCFGQDLISKPTLQMRKQRPREAKAPAKLAKAIGKTKGQGPRTSLSDVVRKLEKEGSVEMAEASSLFRASAL